jgi:hypothetical protein
LLSFPIVYTTRMENDAFEIVILDDADYSAIVDNHSKEVLRSYRAPAWNVSAYHVLANKSYSLKVHAETSIHARNAFVSQMKATKHLGNKWELWKVVKV